MGAGHAHHHGPAPKQAHGHGHGHAHGHGHGHGAGSSSSRAFAIAIALNAGFTLAEFSAGAIGGSMALIADAGHNLSDMLSLVLAWGASVLAARPPSARFTYGFKSSSILAAIANAALLWVAIGAILVETIRRLLSPEPVAGLTVAAIAAIGIAVNGASAWLLSRGHAGQKDDLNIRAAVLHLLADAAVSAGVVGAGLAVAMTGADWLDPAASLLVTAVIAWGSWGLLREALAMALLAVPRGIDEAEVRRHLAGLPGVTAVHDLHIWPMSTSETAITAHLVIPSGHPGDDFLHALAADLHDSFGIVHPTIQVECRAETACLLESEAVV